MNYTYILRCSDGTYYTGWTNDLEKRIQNHNEGKGAKYTKARRPVTLVYYEKFEQKEAAMRKNAQVGDEITTIGGICGRIVAVKDETDSIVIETGSDRAKLRVKRWAIGSVDTVHEDDQT